MFVYIAVISLITAHLSLLRPTKSYWALLMSIYYRRIHITGKVPKDDMATIVIANHTNGFIDPFILQIALGRPLCRTVRADWTGHWLIKWFVKALGAMPLAQGRGAFNRQSFNKLTEALADQRWVVMFPEGINHDRHQLYSFKTGAAFLAEHYMRQTGQPVRVLQLAVFYEDKSRPYSDVWVCHAGCDEYEPKSGLGDKKQIVARWQSAIQQALPRPLSAPEQKQVTWLLRTLSSCCKKAPSVTSAMALLKHNSQLTALYCWLEQANIDFAVLYKHRTAPALTWRLLRESTILLCGLPIAVFGLAANAPIFTLHYGLTHQYSDSQGQWASNAYVIGLPLYSCWAVLIVSVLPPITAAGLLAAGLYSLFFWPRWHRRLRVIATAGRALSVPSTRNNILSLAESVLAPSTMRQLSKQRAAG